MLSRFSHAWLFATLWAVARQVPLSVGFSRQEYWSGLHFFLQGIFLTQDANPHLLGLLHWQAGSLPLVPLGKKLLVQLAYTVKTELKTVSSLLVTWDVGSWGRVTVFSASQIVSTGCILRRKISQSKNISHSQTHTHHTHTHTHAHTYYLAKMY